MSRVARASPVLDRDRFAIRPSWVTTIAVLAVFWLGDTYDWVLYRALANNAEGIEKLGALLVLRYLVPNFLLCAVLATAMFGRGRVLASLGLEANAGKAALLALAFTAPMLVAIAATTPFSPPPHLAVEVVRHALFPGVFEEIFFRAFLFGFLFRFARWGFLPSALAGAIVFGAEHLYQGHDAVEAAGVFALTAAGAVWFAWLYVEWRYNTWVPAFTHVFMNLWWMLFSVSDTALGPPVASGSRLAVIALSVLITVRTARRAGGRRVVGRVWLWPGTRDSSGPPT